jgi:hypothetical protein
MLTESYAGYMNHPMQPLYRDDRGIVRFRPNGIVRRLIHERIVDVGEIAGWLTGEAGVSQDDIDQWWQLMGYSVAGYRGLAEGDVISGEAADLAEESARQLGQ